MKDDVNTVYHVIGHKQFYGRCKFHLFRDCRIMNKGGAQINEARYAPPQRQICKACIKRSKRPTTRPPTA